MKVKTVCNVCGSGILEGEEDWDESEGRVCKSCKRQKDACRGGHVGE